MDLSKELIKMIKGIKLAIYYFDKLDKKTSDAKLNINLLEAKHIFENQLDLMIEDASMADYRLSNDTTVIPIHTALMLKMKLHFIKTDEMIKKEAIKSLKMGAYQGEKFIRKHPHLNNQFRTEIHNIIKQYYQIMKEFEEIEDTEE